jgi:glutamate synthase domain-containing protein 1
MCGIIGFLDKANDGSAPVGNTVLTMLNALACRGPDSAGVALYTGLNNTKTVLRIKLGENGANGTSGDYAARQESIVERVGAVGAIQDVSTTEEYLRVMLDFAGDPQQLSALIESEAEDVEVVSMGNALEIVKQVGSPENLEDSHGVSRITGTHGIGHTRLSTESKVDLSHSQPFWAHGMPDLAVVHNGHITNYHNLRRRYEQHGVHFYTDNDSEVIGVYLADRISQGLSLREALEASLYDLDGSFSYLAATQDQLGFAKDRFALKPLLFTETDETVVVATEEIAIENAFPGIGGVREAQAKEVQVWQLN